MFSVRLNSSIFSAFMPRIVVYWLLDLLHLKFAYLHAVSFVVMDIT